ncbi:hypothetical protein ABK040_003521 [Willaertia magna]
MFRNKEITDLLHLENHHHMNDFTYYYFLFDFFTINELSTSILFLNSKITKNLLENETFWERKCCQYYHTLNSLRFELLNCDKSIWNDQKSLQFENLYNCKELQNISDFIIDKDLDRSRLERESKNQWLIVKCLYLLENINYFLKFNFLKRIKFSKNFLIFRFFTILFKTKRHGQYIFYSLQYEISNDFNISNYFSLIFDNDSDFTIDNEQELKLQYQYFFTKDFLQSVKQKLKLTSEMLMHCFSKTCFPHFFLHFLSLGYSVNLKDSYNKSFFWDRKASRQTLFTKENLFLLSQIDFSLDRGYYLEYIQLCPCVSIIKKDKENNIEKSQLIIKLYEAYNSNFSKCYEYIYPNDITKIINHLDNFFSVTMNPNVGYPLFAKYSLRISVMDFILSFSSANFQRELQNRFKSRMLIGEGCYFKNEFELFDIYNALTRLVNKKMNESASDIKKNLLDLIKEKNSIDLREFCNRVNLKYPAMEEMKNFTIDCDNFENTYPTSNNTKRYNKVRNGIWNNYLYDLEQYELDSEINEYTYLKITIRKCITKYLNFYIFSQPNLVELIPNGKVSRCYNKQCAGIVQCLRMILLPRVSKLVNFLMVNELRNSAFDISEFSKIEKEIKEHVNFN